MYTLGINAVFHDSSAALLKDGILIAAAEDERFTEFKHGKRPVPFSTYELPFHAIYYCLKEAGITLAQVDDIAYSFDPGDLDFGNITRHDYVSLPLKPGLPVTDPRFSSPWDALFLSSLLAAPEQLRDGYPHHLEDRFRNAGDIRSRWHYVNHHLSHAASAFLVSPYTQAAVLTLDGRGEIATTSYHLGSGNNLKLLGKVNLPHSLGLLYEKLTTWLGFLHSSDEYKVMALASYGKPEFASQFRNIVTLEADGQYRIDQAPLEEHFGPARIRGAEFTTRHFNIAHSMQVVLEETVVELSRWLHKVANAESLCMAGGVALNCVSNARIRDQSPFKNVWVQPAAGDAGTSLGAALWASKSQRPAGGSSFSMDHVYWGPGYSDTEIEKFLKWTKTAYRKMAHPARETAELLAADRIIGWFQGRMEFGPRALGNRSILASPLHPEMQAKLNDLKDREDFRPVAPAVLEDKAAEWFKGCDYAPFMLFIYDILAEKGDQIPAVRHVDGTARVQTVNEAQNPLYHALLHEFEKLTGVPILINTSFNTRGKPIVCTPHDALACFYTSAFDALVIGSFLVEKAGKEAL